MRALDVSIKALVVLCLLNSNVTLVWVDGKPVLISTPPLQGEAGERETYTSLSPLIVPPALLSSSCSDRAKSPAHHHAQQPWSMSLSKAHIHTLTHICTGDFLHAAQV